MKIRWASLALALLLVVVSVLPVSAAPIRTTPETRLVQPQYVALHAPVDKYPTLKGVSLTVPVGAALPEGDALWAMLLEAETYRLAQAEVSPDDWRFAIHYHSKWYEKKYTNYTHSSWVLGNHIANQTSTPFDEQLSVQVQVSTSVSASTEAMEVLKTQFNLSMTVSKTETTTLTIPPGQARSIWGAAALRDNLGIVHFQTYEWHLSGWKLVEDRSEWTLVSQPTGSMKTVTESCASCPPSPPTW